MLKNIVLSQRYHCVWLKLAFCRQLLTKHIVNLNVWPFFEKVDMKIAIFKLIHISTEGNNQSLSLITGLELSHF